MAYSAEELKKQLEEEEKKQQDDLREQQARKAADDEAEQANLKSAQKNAIEEIQARIAEYKDYATGRRKMPRKIWVNKYYKGKVSMLGCIIEEDLYFRSLINGEKVTMMRIPHSIPDLWDSVLRQNLALLADIKEATRAIYDKFSKKKERGDILIGLAGFGIIIFVAILLIRSCLK